MDEPAKGPRRWGLIIGGIVVAFVGVFLLIAGAVVGFVEQTRSSIVPEAEGRTPNSVTFLAENARYKVSVQGERFGADASIASSTRCVVKLADESRIELDGSRQAISEKSGNIASVGSFDAVFGRTTITCVAPEDGVRFFVDHESILERAGTIAVIAGFVVCAIGAVLILLGVFWRKPPVAKSDIRLV